MTSVAPALGPYEAAAHLHDYTKTQRVFAWTILYLAEKPEVIAALRRHFTTVRSDGDMCLHHILDFRASDSNSTETAMGLYEMLGPLRSYWSIAWKYVRYVLKNWLDKGHLGNDSVQGYTHN